MTEKSLIIQKIFLEIIKAELNGNELETGIKKQLTEDVIPALYSLSKQHDLAHIVSSCLYKNGLITDCAVVSKLVKEEMLSVYRFEQISYAYNQICKLFDDNKIEYIPLKGSVIRPFYPKESMRTSCDIDILIREEKLDVAVELLKQNGYAFNTKNYHDVSLFSPNGVNLELHFNILEDTDNIDSVLKNAWAFAVPVNDCQYKFTDEFFVFHMFAHMSYHFLSGGCGVRSLMDIWVMENKMNLSYKLAKNLLEQAEIYKFSKTFSDLTGYCFVNEDNDEFFDVLLQYIFSGGTFGNIENRIVLKRLKNQNSIVYLIKRLFPSYSTMVGIYPFLKKLPILLPVMWIGRLFSRVIHGNSKTALTEAKVISRTTDEKKEIMQAMRSRLGL